MRLNRLAALTGLVLIAATGTARELAVRDREVLLHTCAGSDGQQHTVIEDLFRDVRTGKLTSAYVQHDPERHWQDQDGVHGEALVNKEAVRFTEAIPPKAVYGYESPVGLPKISITYLADEPDTLGTGEVTLQDGLINPRTYERRTKTVTLTGCKATSGTLTTVDP